MAFFAKVKIPKHSLIGSFVILKEVKEKERKRERGRGEREKKGERNFKAYFIVFIHFAYFMFKFDFYEIFL